MEVAVFLIEFGQFLSDLEYKLKGSDSHERILENMKTKTLKDMRELVNGNAAHKADYLLPFGEPGQEQHLSKVISISFFFYLY
mgnify:FL=1